MPVPQKARDMLITDITVTSSLLQKAELPTHMGLSHEEEEEEDLH